VVEDEDLVKWIMVTSNPIRLYGVFQWPESSKWSNQFDKSNGCSRGCDGTMLCALHSSCVAESIMPTKGRMPLKILMISSWMPLLDLVLWLDLHPRQ
jgi:hypothetical protein